MTTREGSFKDVSIGKHNRTPTIMNCKKLFSLLLLLIGLANTAHAVTTPPFISYYYTDEYHWAFTGTAFITTYWEEGEYFHSPYADSPWGWKEVYNGSITIPFGTPPSPQ